jgi:hypothetical protein
VLETAAADVRYGVRQLWRRPAFATIAVLTLGLGIGASTTIFSVVNPILLRSLPYPEADRLMMIEDRQDGNPQVTFGYIPRGHRPHSHIPVTGCHAADCRRRSQASPIRSASTAST